MNLSLTRPHPLRFLTSNLRHASFTATRWRTFIPLWMKGFTTQQIALYDLTTETARHYLPDFFKYRITLNTNKNVWPLLHDKLLFHYFAHGSLPTSPLLMYTSAGSQTWLDAHVNERTLATHLATGTRFLVKPLQGGGGVGLTFIDPAGSDTVLVNGDQQSIPSLLAWLATLPYHGLYRREEQHPAIAALYPRTVNTLRVTVFRPANAEPRILDAIIRVGVKRSEPVDNTGKGAVTVHIGEDGVTDAAHVSDESGTYVPVTAHPDTGVELLGVTMPYWRETVDLLLGIHTRFPAFDLVGWDVLVTPNGPIVIEGNHNMHLRAAFLHSTFADRPDFLEFCLEKHLIDKRPTAS